MFSVNLIGVIFTVLVGLCAARRNFQADQYFNLCSRDDPKIDACIERAINSAVKLFVQEHAELKVPSLDPFLVPELEFDQRKGFKFYSKFTDVVITGLGQGTVEKVRTELQDPSKLNIKFTVKYPRVEFDADADVNGKLIGVPIKGNGHAHLNMTGMAIQVTLKSQNAVMVKNGKQYMQIQTMLSKVTAEKGTCQLINIFSGDKKLASDVSAFVTTNFNAIFDAVGNVVDDAFSLLMKSYINRILIAFPQNTLFLD